MRRLLLVCATVCLCAATLSAQAQNQNQTKVKLTGTVVNAVTNEPVRGAMINVQGTDAKSAMTGSDGHFEFELDVPSGAYLSVMATRPGFAPTNPIQSVRIGSSIEPLVIKLTPTARIAGRVTDREGEPIDGVQIQCLHEQLLNGRKQWQQANGASTDENGHFLIEDLWPGTYILFTRPYTLYRTLQHTSEASRYIYPFTYYPDATSRDMAQRIELAAGQEMKVDMELHSVRASRVIVATEPRSPSVMGNLTSDFDDGGQGVTMADPSGVLTFGAVPPGSWKIVVNTAAIRRPGGNNDNIYGELNVDVGTTDIDHLTLPLNKPADIPVVVSGAAIPQVFVQLFSKNGPVNSSMNNQNGGLEIHSVIPGSYRVVARPNGSGCITSITSGSQDLLRDQLVVSPGGTVPPIQVVESDNCPQLSITPTTKEQANLIVTSSLPGFEPMQLFSFNGNSPSINLSPGEYQVYAFDNVSNLEYANPDAMFTISKAKP